MSNNAHWKPIEELTPDHEIVVIGWWSKLPDWQIETAWLDDDGVLNGNDELACEFATHFLDATEVGFDGFVEDYIAQLEDLLINLDTHFEFMIEDDNLDMGGILLHNHIKGLLATKNYYETSECDGEFYVGNEE